MLKIVVSMLIFTFSTSLWAKDLVIHEWGTFTSFMGSDGEVQEGMHHEEEPLPNFVYGVGNSQEPRPTPQPPRRDNRDCPEFTKIPCDMIFGITENRNLNLGLNDGLFGESLPQNPLSAGITQKMETPVIYFYGDEGTEISVNISFPQGIISQYFPRAAKYSPKFSDVSSIGPSEFQFDIKLLGVDDNNRLPYTQSRSIWNPARNVQANTIIAEGGESVLGPQSEQEKFIFYRGVGDFSTNLKVTSPKDSQIVVTNSSKQEVPFAILLHSDGNRGQVVHLGSLLSRQGTAAAVLPNLQKTGEAFADYVQTAKTSLKTALVNTGLFADEAQAMVDTWENSYFNTPGSRILYIVPNVETERILPMKIAPKPKKLVRTLVGRVELMTHEQEQNFLQLLAEHSEALNLRQLFGRLYEPKVRRLIKVAQASELDQNVKDRVLGKLRGAL